MNDEPIRLLIADDHVEFRRGLEALLQTGSGLGIVGTASTGTDAIQQAAQLQPDVVVMDLHMPDIHGVEATRQIVYTSPHIRVLVFTMFDDDDSVFAAMQAGARGYLLKGAGRDEILRAIAAVAQGDAIFGPGLAHRIAGFFSAASGRPDPFPQLSAREDGLLQLIAEGRSNTDIARRLYLSPKTVRNHISNIFTKLEVASRAEAIILAREAGLGRQQSSRWSPPGSAY